MIPRLLVVGDDTEEANPLSGRLKDVADTGLVIDRVATLAEAVAACDTATYDGVVLQLDLPDSAGIETLQRIKSASDGVPIVVFTGRDSDDQIRRWAVEQGAQDFVSRDEEPSRQLARSVRAALQQSQIEGRRRQLEHLVAAIPDAVIVTDQTGIVRYVNDTALTLFARSRDDFVGELIGFSVEEGQVSEMEILRGDERRSAEIRVVECEWDNQPAFLALIRDITEQKRLGEQLRQAQKMEAIGIMAGGVAHDFNNLLLVMLIYAELARDDCAVDDPNLPGLVEIVRAIERGQALTRQLLAFSRRQSAEHVVLDLSSVVAGVYSMLRRTLPENIEIAMVAADNLWSVVADPGQVEQLLMNMAMNAKDAMPNGGRLALELENHTVERSDGAVAPGEYVLLRVADTGQGIAPQHLGRVFEPFFTTKERGHGTGLGLATCYGIVAQAGGHISVTSRVGHGTQFVILLPRTLRTPAGTSAAPKETQRYRGHETILVVEDDPAVLGATAATLRNSGYKVLTAPNGDEACRVLQRDGATINAVLSDVVMPQLGGVELAEFVDATFPRLPVVFMTGYSTEPMERRDGSDHIRNRRTLMKPFAPQELLKVIRETLDGTGVGRG